MSNHTRRLVLLFGIAFGAPLPVLCQPVELGGTIGLGARGSEGGLVRQEALAIGGVYGSVFLTNRLETMVRVAWLDLGARNESTPHFLGCPSPGVPRSCPPEIAYRIVNNTGAPRTFITNSWLFHFQPTRVVRPFLGPGFGIILDRKNLSCEPVGGSCDSRGVGSLRLGKSTSARPDIIFIAGLSTAFEEHFVLRGVIHFHMPGGDDVSLYEAAVTFGYRL